MGLFGAMTTSVSGLQAQAFAMQNISGNIANSQTIAFKGINTSFEELIPGVSVASQETAGGVFASSVGTNGSQGAIQSTTSSTAMAINGDGYFTVQSPLGFTGNTPNFGGARRLYAPRRLQRSARKAIWSTAAAIISKERQSTRQPAIRSAPRLPPCNSRATFCRLTRRPQ